MGRENDREPADPRSAFSARSVTDLDTRASYPVTRCPRRRFADGHRGYCPAAVDENDPEGLARAYVALGLRLGRVVPGLVDAHLGDPAIARRVADEPAPDPAGLRRDAAALRARLAREPSVDPDRAEYLDAQLAACEVIAARAAGVAVGVVEEVRDCLGVAVGPGEPDEYRAAHARLADLLATSVRRLPKPWPRSGTATGSPPSTCGAGSRR